MTFHLLRGPRCLDGPSFPTQMLCMCSRSHCPALSAYRLPVLLAGARRQANVKVSTTYGLSGPVPILTLALGLLGSHAASKAPLLAVQSPPSPQVCLKLLQRATLKTGEPWLMLRRLDLSLKRRVGFTMTACHCCGYTPPLPLPPTHSHIPFPGPEGMDGWKDGWTDGWIDI